MNTRVGGWDGAPAISSIVEFWADVNQADVYYILQDIGHNIPMGDQYNVDTPSLIWEFFSRY